MENSISKKHITIIAVVVVTILCAFGFGLYTWFSSLDGNTKQDVKTQELKLSVTDYTLELGDTPPDFKKFIMKSDIKDVVEIDTSEYNNDAVGTYKVHYKHTDVNIPYANTLTINIIDTTPPTMKVKNLVMDVGSDIDVMQFVEEYKDYQKVTFEFKDVPDMNKKGNQYIRISATDESGNNTYHTVTLTLNEKNAPSPDGGNGGSVVEPTTPNNGQGTSPQTPTNPSPSTPQQSSGTYAKFPIEQHGTFDDAFASCKVERANQISKGATGTGSCRPYKIDGINKGYELVWE